MFEDVADIVRAQAGVYGHEYTTGGKHAKVRLKQRRDVWREKRHAVALLEPRIEEPGGEAIHPLFELLVGVAPVPVYDGHLIRVDIGATPEKAYWRKLVAVYFLILRQGISFPLILWRAL